MILLTATEALIHLVQHKLNTWILSRQVSGHNPEYSLFVEQPIIYTSSFKPGSDESKRRPASSSSGVLASGVNSECVAWVAVQELFTQSISLIHIPHSTLEALHQCKHTQGRKNSYWTKNKRADMKTQKTQMDGFKLRQSCCLWL